MKGLFPAVLAAVMLLAGQALAQEKAPNSLAGLELGRPVTEYRSLLEIKTAKSAAETPWLSRANVKPGEVFRGGYVLFGACAAPGRIVRLKLKYADEGQALFGKIVSNLIGRYGNPSEYKGDLEGQVMGNKWSFTDPNGHSISLILQRYLGDELDLTRGNVIMLADRDAMEAERLCYERKGKKSGKEKTEKRPESFDGYLPR